MASVKSKTIHLLSKFILISNAFGEMLDTKKAQLYRINSGIGYGGINTFSYNERLVEVPFLFRSLPKDKALTVLDVGCCESTVPIQLSMIGHKVTGIDIREFGYKNKNFNFIKDDFLTHPFREKFDIAIDISAIEHFGLEVYGSGATSSADISAIRKIHSLLKKGGQFIFTAPFGSVHEIIGSYERAYAKEDIPKLFKGFKILNMEFYVITNHKYIEQVSQSVASKIRFAQDKYAVMLVNASKN